MTRLRDIPDYDARDHLDCGVNIAHDLTVGVTREDGTRVQECDRCDTEIITPPGGTS